MRPRLRFDSRYSFAIGRICVLEKYFFSKQIFDRLLGSSSPQEMGRILSECGYRSEFSIAGSWIEIENGLEHEWNDAIHFVCQLNKDPFWIDLFRKRADYHNLKVLLKGKLSGEHRVDLFQEGGFVSIELLREKVQSEETDNFPPFFRDVLQRASEALSETNDPTLIDLVVDQLETEDWNSTLGCHQNHFLLEWWRFQVDLINLTTFLRIKLLKEEPLYLERIILDGGNLKRDFLLPLIEEPWKTVCQALERTAYHEMVVRAVRDLENKKGFFEWEQTCHTMNWQYLQFARQFGFGLEVLFSYLLVKEKELSLIRRILIGKANGLSKDTITSGVSYDIL